MQGLAHVQAAKAVSGAPAILVRLEVHAALAVLAHEADPVDPGHAIVRGGTRGVPGQPRGPAGRGRSASSSTPLEVMGLYFGWNVSYSEGSRREEVLGQGIICGSRL